MQIRIDNLIIIIVFALIIGCTTKEDKFKGYYYNQQHREIYFFKEKEVDIYSFSDSIISKAKYDFEKDDISIGNEIYKYHNDNDTLFLNNFSKERESIKLLKFNFKPFDLKKLASKSFMTTVEGVDRESNQYYEEEHFFKVDKRLGFDFFYNDKRTSDTIYNGHWVYEKMYLNNKFPILKGPESTPYIVCNYNEGEVEFLELTMGVLFTLAEITPKEPDSLLYGKWRQIEDVYNIDIFKQYAYSELTDSNKYKDKVEEIKNDYDMGCIEFLKKGILKRYLKKETTISHKIKFGITSKYIFIEKFVDNKYFGVLEVEKITNDSLVLHIIGSKIRYKYIRDN